MTLQRVVASYDSIANMTSVGAEEQDNVASNIFRIRNTENSFLRRLRNFLDRAQIVLSNAWQWVRSNVFCCFSNTVIDGVEEDTPVLVSYDQIDTDSIVYMRDFKVVPEHLSLQPEGVAGGATAMIPSDLMYPAPLKPIKIDLATLSLPINLMTSDNLSIIEFWCGLRTTHTGEDVNTILNYTDSELESKDSFMSYLFPLPKYNRLSQIGPLTDENIAIALALNSQLRNVYLQYVDKMLNYWKLKLTSHGMVELQLDFDPKTARWLQIDEQEMKRVTHLITSLGYLGFIKTAKSLQNLVLREAVGSRVSGSIREQWKNALN